MIYDCFTFFNELDLLEIRLEELYPIVDQFVICESVKTHTGKDKPLRYLENIDRYKKYQDKIKYVVYKDFPIPQNWSYRDNWIMEANQRRFLISGINLKNLEDDDTILVSDIDEIPKRSFLKGLLYSTKPDIVTLCSQLYYGKINYKVVFPDEYSNWRGTVCLRGQIVKKNPDLHHYRLYKDSYPCTRDTGSWHFSYVGTEEQIIYKIESYIHGEFNNENVKNSIKDNLKNCKDILNRDDFKLEKVQIDDSYPEAVKENPSKYENLISFTV